MWRLSKNYGIVIKNVYSKKYEVLCDGWTFYQQTKFYNEMTSHFLSFKNSVTRGDGVRVSNDLAANDKRPTLSWLGEGVFKAQRHATWLKKQNVKEFRTFLEVSRAFQNGNISLFLALLSASLKAAETPFVFLYREFSQNLKNCKQY